MGLFKWLSENSEDNSQKNDDKVSISIGGDFFVDDRKAIPKYDEKIAAAITKLAAFYREHVRKYANPNVPTESFVKLIAPHSDSHTCPYCGTVHDFTASRARKCPDCGKKMIVRAGHYLSQEQADKIEATTSEYYDKSWWIDRLKNSIGTIQSCQKDHNYSRALQEIAESYQACAIVHNVSHPEDKGFTFWDYSWQFLQEASIAAVEMSAGQSNEAWVWNGYLDSLYARGQHCLREMKYAVTDKAKKRYASIAINMIYLYLSEAMSLNRQDDWRREEAIKMIYVAQILGKLDKEDIKAIENRVRDSSSKRVMSDEFEKSFKEVADYVFLETEPDRLRWMIN